MSELTEWAKIFIAVFVLVNPLEGIPIFLVRTQQMSEATRLGIARTAALTVTVVLLVALLIGRALLALFGISVPAFTLAGGIIILLIALDMVNGKFSARPAATASPAAEGSMSFAVTPLGIPLLGGPGPISSVILYASRGTSGNGCTWADYAVLSGIILVVGTATFVSLMMAEPARRKLGDTGIDVMTRVAGILVAAIAVTLVAEGAKALFPVLAR